MEEKQNKSSLYLRIPDSAIETFDIHHPRPYSSLHQSRKTSLLGQPLEPIKRGLFSPGSILGSAFTILAVAVGAGILTLPYAMNLGGMSVVLIVTTCCAFLSIYTCRLLIMISEELQLFTYESLGVELYGWKVGKFTDFCLMFNNYGSCLAYTTLLKSTIPHALKISGVDNDVATSEILWGFLVTVNFIQVTVIYPLAFFQQISALRYASFISFCTCLYLSIAITSQFFELRSGEIDSRFADAPQGRSSAYGNLEIFPLIIFAFLCQSNVIPVYKELSDRSVKRGTIAMTIALVLVLILYLFASLFGFLTFYKEYDSSLTDFPDQILNAKYGHDNTVTIIATYAVSGTLLFSAPLNVYPCRDSFYTFFWPGQDISRTKHIISVTGIVFSILGIALVVPNISVVITFFGTIFNPTVIYKQVMFFLPISFYIKTYPGSYARPDILFAIFVFILMLAISIIAFTLFIMGLAGYTLN